MSWRGRTVVITAGPTREYLDPVRFITNASTGRMGFALARAARRRGAQVIVVCGPISAPPPSGVRVLPVVSADEMRRRTLSQYARADVIIAAAAVGDWRPAKKSARKLKKDGRPLRMTFVPTADTLASLSRRRGRRRTPVLVGFALETHSWIENARKKLRRKNADIIVANRHTAMGAARTRIAVLARGGRVKRFPPLSKERAAAEILRAVGEVIADA